MSVFRTKVFTTTAVFAVYLCAVCTHFTGQLKQQHTPNTLFSKEPLGGFRLERRYADAPAANGSQVHSRLKCNDALQHIRPLRRVRPEAAFEPSQELPRQQHCCLLLLFLRLGGLLRRLRLLPWLLLR